MADDENAAFRQLRAAGVQAMAERLTALLADWDSLRGEVAADPRVWDEERRQRAAALAQMAHRLAGAGGTFGFPAVSAAAVPLEWIFAGLGAAESINPGHLEQASQLVQSLHEAWRRGPAEKAEDTRAEKRDGANLPVAIFANRDLSAAYASTVASLGYPIVRHDPAGSAPPMDGRALAAAVIDDGCSDALGLAAEVGRRCPVLLATEDVSFPYRLAAARAGVQAILPKPVDVNELADWLDTLAGRGPDAPFSVLVVDDDVLLAEAYALALQRGGISVNVVTDPAAAFEAIAANVPDLVLMDLQMPDIDGIELARVIRQTRRHLFLPVVFLSAEQDADRQLAARRLGGDDFISKPVDLDRLVSLVRLRAERAQALRAVMERDSLTGLLNHGRFKDRLSREVERCKRVGGTLSVAIIDLDHFKKVNDDYGHLTGDRVIRTLARMLGQRLRQTDVVGRYGGEEFAVLLLDTRPTLAAGAIENVRQRLAATRFDSGGQAFFVTLSAGIAGWQGQESAEELIAAADRLLYAAKRAGRNRVLIDDMP